MDCCSATKARIHPLSVTKGNVDAHGAAPEKSEALDFMKATTELSAAGTWQDPKGAANDLRADNVILEVEYGEIEGETIGNGIILALSLINNLEINEEILYGRMKNIEQSTLIA